MIRNLSTFKKIGLLIFILLIAMSLLQLIGFRNMTKISNNSEDLYNKRLLPSNILSKYRLNNRAAVVDMWHIFTETDEKTGQFLKTDATNKLNENKQLLQQLKNANLTPKEHKIIIELIKLYPDFSSQMLQNIQLGYENKNVEALNQFSTKTNLILSEIISRGDQLTVINNKEATAINLSNKRTFKVAARRSIEVYLLIIIFSIIFTIYVSRLITKPIYRLLSVLETAKEGDLTQEALYESKDELGRLSNALNETSRNLRKLIRGVQETSEQVAAYSSQLSASAEQTSEASEHIASVTLEVASGTDDQVRTVVETSETVHQMVGQAQFIGNNSNIVNEAAKEAEKLSKDGNEVIQKAVEQMSSIHQTISSLNSVITSLGKRSGEIGEIVNVITGIASQTNLLALNAAIEAARVGEQGKGFAVVASEVRGLAEESASSANKISTMISAIQSEVNIAIQSMEQTINQVEIGAKNVNNAGNSFGKIQHSINEVSNQINEVSSSVQQMVAGTEQLGRSIEEISSIAQNSAASTQNISAATEEQLATMEEIAASSTALAKMAEDLKSNISVFKV